MAALAGLARNARVHVVLSNHYVRYAVLPWSKALASDDDWQAFALHSFQSTYGAGVAANWHIKVSRAGAKRARVASAVDASLVDALRDVPGVASIRPYLMNAFNVRRRSLGKGTWWFVLQEAGRLVISRLVNGEWQLIRRRRAGADWKEALPQLLDRELLAEQRPDAVAICSEEEVAGATGDFRLVDLTLPPGASADMRPHVMALH